MIDSFSVYKGANATAETIRIFTHRRKLLSEATNHCFLPIKKPSRNSPAVWKKRPALTAHSRLAFCPRVVDTHKKFPHIVIKKGTTFSSVQK